MLNFNGKVVVITGAGKGLGLEISKNFYKLGAKVALITRGKEDIENLELIFDKAKSIVYHGDVSDSRDVNSFIEAVLNKFEKIDVLINNAGMRFRKNFLEISDEEFTKVIDVNLRSVFFLSQKVISHMVEAKSGKIINISSIAGEKGFSQLSGYVTSKAAISGLTKSLAVEFAEFNIQINAIAPGFVKTSFYDSFKKNTELYNFTIARTPMGRWGNSEEVAKACLFLASEMSSYVNGEILHIDGGWYAS